MDNLQRHLLSQSIPEPNSGCWIWLGACVSGNYGLVYARRFPELGKRRFKAHRASYIAFRGKIGPASCVCHRCDNPTCINPDHLFLGTQAENNADMVRKKRHSRPPNGAGERAGNAKLTLEQAREILASKERTGTLSRRFGVSHGTIGHIRSGRSWTTTLAEVGK